MTTKKPYTAILIAALLAFTWIESGSAEPAVDRANYETLLKKHVTDGRVDYSGFKKDRPQLEQYLRQMAQTDPDRLDRADQMAFYINLYNAATINLILTAYPGIKSIKELGSLFQSPWKKKFIALNGQSVSLDHIEHDILRPRFNDPRVHFAINCASQSCPPLLNEPYRGPTLDAQLDKAASDFINDPHSNYIQGNTLYVSRIFKWFSEDFSEDIKGFVSKFARADLKKQLAAQGPTLKVRYLDYDWSLNGS